MPSAPLPIVPGSWGANRRGVRRRVPRGATLAVLACLVGLALPHPVWAEEIDTFRIGFSSATFGDVNENDARAAVRAWSQALAKERGIPADPQPRTYDGLAAVEAALTNRWADAISLTTEEYWYLQRYLVRDQVVLGLQGDAIADEYILLVHAQSGIETLKDLRGRSLVIHQNPRASLARVWMEKLLLESGLGRLSNFCGQVTLVAKPAKVALPVFFRTADSCIITRRAFNTLIELNPQIGQKLKPLAISPAVVPFVFGFRADYHSPIRDQILAEISRWHTTAAGRQTLIIFQCDRLEERPATSLESAFKLLERHRAALEKAAATPLAGEPPVSPDAGPARRQDAP